MNENVETFLEGFKSYKVMYDELKKIIDKHNDSMGYYQNKTPYTIDFHNYISSGLDIVISFSTGSLPYDIIKDINDYMGINFSHISSKSGHSMTIHYFLSKR